MGGAGGEMTGSGDVDYTATPPDMQMSMELGPQSVGMLLVEKIMYVQSSQAGGKYIKFDLDDPANPLGSGLSEQLDPAGSVEAFTKAVTSVTSSGSEDVDGRTLDRYELTVDTTKLADDGTGSSASLPPEVTMVVWLDDEGRMAKTSMGLGAVQYDATLSDFDKAVELEAPPGRPGGQPARLLTAVDRLRPSPSRSASAEASKRPTGGAVDRDGTGPDVVVVPEPDVSVDPQDRDLQQPGDEMDADPHGILRASLA